jgi:integrase
MPEKPKSKIKLTEKFVASVKPPAMGRRVIHWDAKQKGFGLLVTDTGHQSFVVQYQVGSGRKSRTLRRMHLEATTVDEARTLAEAIIGAVSRGRALHQPVDPLEQRRQDERVKSGDGTFRAIASDWFKRDSGKQRSGARRFAELKRLAFPVLGGRQIGDIRHNDIVKLLDAIEDTKGPGMADYVLSAMRRVMAWYESREEKFTSPIRRKMARTNATDRARQRILTDDELRAVWRTAEGFPGPYGYFIRFLLLTATRRKEAAGMRRDELLSSGDWLVPTVRMKGKLEHIVPLSAAARAILDNIPVIGPFVFTIIGRRPITGFSDYKWAFDKLVLADLRKVADGQGDQTLLAFVEKVEELMSRIATAEGATRQKMAMELKAIWWTLHDLRRTGRSLMGRAGVNPDHAERCLAHKIGGVRGVYDRYAYRNEKAHAFEVLAAQVERIVNPPADNVTSLDKRRARGVSQVPG